MSEILSMIRADESQVMRTLAERIYGNASPDDAGRLAVADAIARYLGMDCPAAFHENAKAEELLAAAIQYVGPLDDPNVGWCSAGASHKDMFKCERCGAEDEDTTLIPHSATCSAMRLVAAVAALSRATEGEAK